MKLFKMPNYYILVLFICYSCQNKNLSKVEYYSNGRIKQINLFDSTKLNRKQILYFENGNLKQVSNYINNQKEGEQLNFFENGLLESKLLFKNNLPNGVAYWFYKSGALRASRFYFDGEQEDLGFDYWDYKVVVNKDLVRLHHGKVYFKLNFDSSGDPTTREGDSLHSGVENVSPNK